MKSRKACFFIETPHSRIYLKQSDVKSPKYISIIILSIGGSHSRLQYAGEVV